MSLWEMVKKGAEEGLEAMKDSVSVFMAEAGKTSKILKKRVELSTMQGNVRKAFIRLGSVAYDLHSRGEQDIYGHEEIKSLIGQIDGYHDRVRKIEEEIEAIKKEEGRKDSAKSSKPGSQPPANPAG